MTAQQHPGVQTTNKDMLSGEEPASRPQVAGEAAQNVALNTDKIQRFAWLRAASIKNIGDPNAAGDLFAHPLRTAATQRAHQDAVAFLTLISKSHALKCADGPDARDRDLGNQILNSQSTCMALLDAAGHIELISTSMLDLLSVQRSDIKIGHSTLADLWPDALHRAKIRQIVQDSAEGAIVQIDVDLGADPNRSRLIDIRISPVVSDASDVCTMAVTCVDVSDYRDAEQEILQTLLRTDVALHAGQTGVWVVDLATGERSWDPRMLQLFGFGEGDAINPEAITERILPEYREAYRCAIEAALDPDTGGEIDVDLRINPAPDVQRWISSRGRVIFENRKPRLIIGTATDITLAKDHDAHIHFLMREVVHRSKNLLAVIQAMARQTAATGGTAREFEERFTARLQALAASHDLLVRDDWRGASAHELVRSQLGHFSELIGTRISIKGTDVILRPEAAQNIGLALHELATNAAKYGALVDDNGIIEVEWRVELKDNERRYAISWIERGGPTVIPPSREGFGHRVMKRIAAHALEGEVRLIFPPAGLEWHLSIPVHHLIGHGGTRPIDPRRAAADAIRNL